MREKLELNNSWQIAFDPRNEGVQKGWPGQHWPAERSLPIHVPGIWNIDYPDMEGIGFYRTSFSVPPSWLGRAIRLHFEGAIYRCDVWIGGKFVGSHEGGYTPFWFNISDHIRFESENVLVVRVLSLSKSGPVDGMILEQTPLSKQSWYYVYGGLWGRVSLEAVPLVYCERAHISPDLRRERAQAELHMRNWGESYRQLDVHLKVSDPHGALIQTHADHIAVPPGLARFRYTLSLPRPLPWSCEQPNLYQLEIDLIGEEIPEDHLSVQFGMRDFSTHKGQFFLNGEPVFVRGILLQPNYPVTLIAHPNREMMVREIALAKEAGFNLIRIHLQPAPPGFLQLADQMGMMIYAESCLAWIRESKRMLDHGQREVAAMIERDYNHPSVVFWGIYNENPPASAINGQELVRMAHALDPTRVIVDNSGGSLAIDQDFGWIDRATAVSSGRALPERYMDIHLYLGSPISASIHDWLRSLGSEKPSRVLVEEGFASTAVMDEFDRECRTYDGKIFVSEVGYGGMSDLVETVAGFEGREDLLDARELRILRDSLLQGFEQRKLERIFGSPRGLFLEAQKLQALGNTQQLEAVLSNPRASGYVLTQLNDVAWEFHAGLLDLWRNPKLSYYAAQKVNQPHVILMWTRRAVANPGDRIELELGLRHRVSLGESNGLLSIMVTAPSGDVVFTKEIDAPLQSGIHVLMNVPFEVRATGTYAIVARLSADGKELANAQASILVLEGVDWSSLPVKPICIGQVSAPLAELGSGPVDLHTIPPDSMKTRLILVSQPTMLVEGHWDTLLAIAKAGGVVVCGALRPEDQGAFRAFNHYGIPVKLHPGIGSWMGCYHWIPNSELFAGLPAGGLAMKPYTQVIPKYILSELGGEVLAGSLRNTQSRQEAPAMLWFSDIETVRHGEGAVVFCQYRVFDKIDQDPLAAKLAYNLLCYAAGLLGK